MTKNLSYHQSQKSNRLHIRVFYRDVYMCYVKVKMFIVWIQKKPRPLHRLSKVTQVVELTVATNRRWSSST
jgi:hypothetical protein